jgi:predicted ATPase/DNA-binding SARP family transcriptional activator
MRFGILGPFVVADDQGRELALGGRKQRSVLAILLLHAGEVLSSDRLIDELWGEHAPATAAKTIQVYVSNLRKALGEGVLLTRGGGYVLETERAEIDAARFEALSAEGRLALQAGDPREAGRRLRDALGLWRGPPLADFAYEPFAQGEAARMEEARQTALEDRIDAELAVGDHATLAGELEALVREHPLRERLSAQLMLALYRAGRQADALDAYQRVRGLLAEELGLEPGPALKALQLQILEQAPSLQATLPAGQDADLPHTAAAGAATKSAIPLPPTPLIGRAQEVDAVRRLLERPGVRLVTLTGPGGVGKTRLAVAVGRELFDRFPGGAFMVRLAGVSNSASIMPMIAEALGVTGQSDLPLLDVLAQRLGEQPTLVILDNFEQLASASTILAELLAHGAELRALVTSQVPLRVAAEQIVAVGPLAPEDAVGLFLERARAVVPDLAPVADDLAAIEDICVRLDSMPLAIELAAARVRLLGPRALERRLERPLDLLTRGGRDAPERQRSLRAAIEWTHALLDPGQQSLLASLGVCVGAVPLSLVEAVAGPGSPPLEILDRLEGLVEFSFVRRQADRRLGIRFLVPQALRDFGLERLVAAREEDRVRRLHAEHVSQIAHSARLWKWGASPEQRSSLLAVLQEVRPAVAWARDHDPGLYVHICADLASYWVYAGVLAEVGEELRRAREIGAGSVSDRAWISTLLAKCAQLQVAEDAVQLADEALATWRSVDDEQEGALGLGPASWVMRWDARYDESIALAKGSLEVLRRSGDRRLILRGLVFLAHALADSQDVDATEAVLMEAEKLADGDPTWELAAIHADCAEVRGDTAAAVRLYSESLAWTSTTGESHQMLMDLRALATNLSHLGDREGALEVAELVRLEEERTGRVGDLPASVEWFGEAVATARELVSPGAAESAAMRAREVPADRRAEHALELAERALGLETAQD